MPDESPDQEVVLDFSRLLLKSEKAVGKLKTRELLSLKGLERLRCRATGEMNPESCWKEYHKKLEHPEESGLADTVKLEIFRGGGANFNFILPLPPELNDRSSEDDQQAHLNALCEKLRGKGVQGKDNQMNVLYALMQGIGSYCNVIGLASQNAINDINDFFMPQPEKRSLRIIESEDKKALNIEIECPYKIVTVDDKGLGKENPVDMHCTATSTLSFDLTKEKVEPKITSFKLKADTPGFVAVLGEVARSNQDDVQVIEVEGSRTYVIDPFTQQDLKDAQEKELEADGWGIVDSALEQLDTNIHVYLVIPQEENDIELFDKMHKKYDKEKLAQLKKTAEPITIKVGDDNASALEEVKGQLKSLGSSQDVRYGLVFEDPTVSESRSLAYVSISKNDCRVANLTKNTFCLEACKEFAIAVEKGRRVQQQGSRASWQQGAKREAAGPEEGSDQSEALGLK